jgi:multisubunit Na+/H+ antiporter MnhG subunit
MVFKMNLDDWKLWLHYGFICAVLLYVLDWMGSAVHGEQVLFLFAALVLADVAAHYLLNFD